ncbi:hypothetical protein O1611_g6579 [Lasiodiplodia mahajangana]|uniref:Uncharacterized protein n=1 Tax=Lasiodiplodia mahajangana TaxID=1108764 RepID=A0ACC2JI74_9PEZI|nr:hypothetical protein O1611_g6579 [Lasiodiplodia mahajangana]
MPSKTDNTPALDKKRRAVFYQYLESAQSREAHVGGPWDHVGQRVHGEGRPTIARTRETFHIVVLKDRKGFHKSHVVIGGKKAESVVENTQINHGVNEPTIQQVVNEHKRYHGIDVRSPTPSDDDEEENK